MVDAKTVGFLYTLGIGLVVFTVMLLIFTCVRPKNRRVYQYRRVLNHCKAYDNFNGERVGYPEKRPDRGFLGWVGPTLGTSEAEVVEKIGLDAAMFIRFVRSQLISFAIVSLLVAAFLWPLYGTGPNKNLPEDNEDFVAGLQVLSLSNVERGSGRLWGTLIAEYIIAAVFIFFLYKDYSQYAKYRRSYRTSENPSNYAVAVFDIPESEATEEHVHARFDLMVPGQVAEVIMARKAKKGTKAEAMLNKVIGQKERAEMVMATTGKEPLTRPGMLGALMCWKPKVSAIEHFSSEKERLEQEIMESARDADNSTAAIVVFSNKRAASLIAQANQGNNANEWNVERAGEPEAVHWPAFNIPGYQAGWRAAAVTVFIFLLTFFWLIPATAIMGLANLESLSQVNGFGWAEGIRDLSPAVVGLIENLLPAVILAVFVSLIPVFIRLAVSLTRIHSVHIIDSKTRNYFYIFTIFGSFVFIVLSASALTDLQAMISDPASIPGRLASAIPGNGIFFASFVIIKTLIPLGIQLLNPARLIVRAILLKMSKTIRERRKAEETSSVFIYFNMYGQCMLMSLLGITYSTLAPIVTLCVFLFFAISYAVFKHNIIFATHRKWDGGGWDYPGAFYSVITALLIKQLTMVGVLGLFEGPAEAILAVIPAVFTTLFAMWAHKRYNRVALHGSLHEQYTKSAKLDEMPESYRHVYRQPGVSLPTYRNLSGMVPVDDTYPVEDENCSFVGDDFSEAHVKSEHPDSAVGFVPDRAANRAHDEDDV